VSDDIDADHREARFEDVDLTGAELHHVDLTDARFRDVDLTGVVMNDVQLCNVAINGEISKLTINGVDVGPLIDAELNRRNPLRAKMRPSDAAGFRDAWRTLEELWEGTADRARRLDPALLHASVDGEWSFVETLRHLVFATDSWVNRAILGDPSPWHPLGLPWDGMPETPGVPHDRNARPSLEAVLSLRRERMSTVREVVAALTDETLAEVTVPVEGPGWPAARSYPVRECLLTVLNEEWEHRLYAERDMDLLELRQKG
jgi:hypothetical protein